MMYLLIMIKVFFGIGGLICRSYYCRGADPLLSLITCMS